ncbi:MAG: caspase family protein [Bacteroidia bacterium]|nr:caspase family protein [Bacteroidia bacterium]
MSPKLYATLWMFLLNTIFCGMTLAQSPTIYNESGGTLSQIEKIRQVIEAYTNTGFFRVRPYDGDYYHHLASEHFKKGEYSEALDDYNSAIRYFSGKSSKLARMHYQRGLCWYILQDYEKAVRDFNIAISFRPDVTDSYYFRGKINYLIYNDAGLARRDFEKVLRISVGSSVQTAFCRYFLGDRDNALREMNGLISSTGSFEREVYSQYHYAMAGLQGLMGNAEGATRYLQNALDYGYDEKEWLARDINFSQVSNSYEFTRLMEKYGIQYQSGNWDPAVKYYPPTNEPAITLKNEEPSHTRSTEPATPSSRRAPASVQTRDLSFTDTDGNNRIDANEKTSIRFVVRNNGPAEAEDLFVRISEEGKIAGLEFESEITLGNLKALEEKEVELPIVGGMSLESEKADFTIQVLEKNGFDADNLYITIPTQEFMPPALEIADFHFAAEMGGKMRLGVPTTLKIAVQNAGSGDAENVRMEMILPDNVFTAGENSFDLGTLRPGQSQIIDFEFFTNKRYEGEDVPVIAEITEKYGNYGTRQTMTVHINQQLEVNSRVVINAKPDPAYEVKEIRLTSDVDQNLPRTFDKNPNAIAVVIGNRDYNNPDVPPVDFALQDAASMKNYLVQSFGFDENNIIFLPNATQADFNGIFGTTQDYKARLYNLVKPAESDVFIFYSGHGAPDLQTEEAYFVPVDCDPSLVRFNGYGINTFYANLSKIPYRSLTVVIDACFSGASDRGTLIPQASLVRIKSGNNVLKDPKAMVFTSASGTEIASWYAEQSHSLFTYYFLKGLQGEANANRDAEITLEEMRTYINEQVPYMARRLKNRVQTPEVYGQNEKIIINN